MNTNSNIRGSNKENCRILAENCMMNNDTWVTGLNNNDIVIGPSGSGKTRSYVKPNILQCNESMIIADTKGSIQKEVEVVLKQSGYKVINIDFTDCFSSYGYNPLDYVRYDEENGKYREQDIMTVSACIIPLENTKEPVWDLSARMYLESIIAYVLECLPQEEHTLGSVVTLFNEMPTGRFDRLFMELCELNPESFAVARYKMYRGTKNAEKMYESIRAMIAERLSSMAFDGARVLFCNPNKIDFASLGREKTAVFLTISDTDRSLDRIVNLFYTQALMVLCNSADKDYEDNRLKVPVRMILDDFASNVYIPDFDKIISVIRSREIYVSIILQSISQLDDMYGEAKARTILNNCDNCLYLGGQDVETARYVSTKANRTMNSVLTMPLESCWLFTRGKEPRMVNKFDLKTHKKYKELPEYKAKVS